MILSTPDSPLGAASLLPSPLQVLQEEQAVGVENGVSEQGIVLPTKKHRLRWSGPISTAAFPASRGRFSRRSRNYSPGRQFTTRVVSELLGPIFSSTACFARYFTLATP
jgi:hypothetical protein